MTQFEIFGRQSCLNKAIWWISPVSGIKIFRLYKPCSQKTLLVYNHVKYILAFQEYISLQGFEEYHSQPD